MKQERIKKEILNWSRNEEVVPLILHGSKYCGKWRLISGVFDAYRNVATLDFEKSPVISDILDRAWTIDTLLPQLSVIANTRIVGGETLLVFANVPFSFNIMPCLHTLNEAIPGLHVAATVNGVITETKGKQASSIVSYRVFPLAFSDFLVETGHGGLYSALTRHSFSMPLHSPTHQQLLSLWGQYMVVGGFPDAASAWIKTKNVKDVRKIHRRIIKSYKGYVESLFPVRDRRIAEAILFKLPNQQAAKFMYARVAPGVRAQKIRQILSVLRQAGLIHIVPHSACCTVPLNDTQQVKNSVFKTLFVDIGLAQTILKTSPNPYILSPEQCVGAATDMARAFVGQELIHNNDNAEINDSLVYWARQSRNALAKVDYVIAVDGVPLPIVIKPGSSGRIKAIHRFLKETRHKGGVHLSNRNFRGNASLSTSLPTVPLYAVSELFHKPLSAQSKSQLTLPGVFNN